MNFLILGDGPEEWAWARAVEDQPEHRLLAACPGFKDRPELPGGRDLDDALATAGVDAAIIGGPPEWREEAIRRAAGAGLPIIALHPPGPNADPYYNVALSRQETGAVVVPDLPLRRHPGVAALQKALQDGAFGVARDLRFVRFESSVPEGSDLQGEAFPRAIDAVRALVGEVEAVNATGDPPGLKPAHRLVVQARGAGGRQAEIRLEAGPPVPSRLAVSGPSGSLALEFDPGWLGPARLVEWAAGEAEVITDLGPWDPHTAILQALTDAVAGRPAHPDLLDGTRSMEVAEAVGRSLRRGRTIDMVYEEMSEEANFKSVMTSTGCALIVGAVVLYVASRAGVALGLAWAGYVAWLIPPLFVLFFLVQGLRFGLRRAPAVASKPPGPGPGA